MTVAMARRYGWALKGDTPVIERPARGRRLTLMGAIALDGPRALRTVDGFVNGEEFIRFLREDLAPNLRPGDIVVMDGPSIHRVKGVAEVLDEVGARPLYLPAYSPELNPIEMVWAWLKKLIRDHPPRRMPDLQTMAHHLWNNIESLLCASCIRHCGYSQSC